MKVSVKVPASSANLGPGFDCLGLALPIYNTITIEETVLPGTGIEINIIDETNEQDVISIPTDDEGYVRVLAEPTSLDAMEKAFEAAGITEFETNEVKLIPSDEIELDGEKLVKFERLLDMLDEVDDVQNLYHNVEI